MESPSLFIIYDQMFCMVTTVEGLDLFRGPPGSPHSTYLQKQASMQVLTVSAFLALMADSKGDDWM